MTIDIYGSLLPLDGQGNPKHKFEVRMKNLGSHPTDGIEKAVFLDDKKLDFKIDVIRFLEARNKGVEAMIQEQKRIEKEFVKVVSEALGRRVTKDEIKAAIAEGWI
jgi:hypothetical protein